MRATKQDATRIVQGSTDIPSSSADRRLFLKASGGMALVGAVPGLARSAGGRKAGDKLDLELELWASPNAVSICQGKSTRLWRYHAKVLHGPHQSK